MVGESVAVGNLTVTVGTWVFVAVIVGFSVEVGIPATVAEDIVGDGWWITCVGRIVGLPGAHPAKAKAGIKRRDNK